MDEEDDEDNEVHNETVNTGGDGTDTGENLNGGD